MDFKIKALAQDDRLYLAVLITVVGVASFGLGRLSGGYSAATSATQTPEVAAVPISVPPPVPAPAGSQAGVAPPAAGEAVVASKSGERYHYSWCPGAGQIKEANRITFASAALAEAAGYTRAANCPQVR